MLGSIPVIVFALRLNRIPIVMLQNRKLSTKSTVAMNGNVMANKKQLCPRRKKPDNLEPIKIYFLFTFTQWWKVTKYFYVGRVLK